MTQSRSAPRELDTAPSHALPLRPRQVPALLLQAVKDFGRDDALAHGAALAFYTSVSLAPIVVLVVIASTYFGEGAGEAFLGQVRGLVGETGAKAVESIVEGASKDLERRRGSIAIAAAVAAFGASAVFAHLQRALNHVWNVQPVPGWNLWKWVRKRLLSFALLVTVAFLLVVSLAVSAGLAFLFTKEALPWRIAELAVSLGVFTALFAFMFRLLPDVKISWRETWIGATVTSVLFAAGKYAIGTYLGLSKTGQAYGAAGSFLALLVWVYWSSVIVLLGAEITQAYVTRRRGIRPDGPAVVEEKPQKVTSDAAPPRDERARRRAPEPRRRKSRR
jgi:membrane protein